MSAAMQLKPGTSSGNFSHSGGNKYKPLRRRRGEEEDNVIEFNYFANVDKRMNFEKSQDPVFMAFEHIDGLPLNKVLVEMTKETVKDLKKVDLEEAAISIRDGFLQIVHSVIDDDFEARAEKENQRIVEDVFKQNLQKKFNLLRQRR